MIIYSFNCFYAFFHCFLSPFAGDCKSGLRLSESHLISSFLVFSVGLDLGLVCRLVVTCNSSSGTECGSMDDLATTHGDCVFSPSLIVSATFCMVGCILAMEWLTSWTILSGNRCVHSWQTYKVKYFYIWFQRLFPSLPISFYTENLKFLRFLGRR